MISPMEYFIEKYKMILIYILKKELNDYDLKIVINV